MTRPKKPDSVYKKVDLVEDINLTGIPRHNILNSFSDNFCTEIKKFLRRKNDLDNILYEIQENLGFLHSKLKQNRNSLASKQEQWIRQAKKTHPNCAKWILDAISGDKSVPKREALTALRKAYHHVKNEPVNIYTAKCLGNHTSDNLFLNQQTNPKLMIKIFDRALEEIKSEKRKNNIRTRNNQIFIDTANLYYKYAEEIPKVTRHYLSDIDKNSFHGNFLIFCRLIYGHLGLKIEEYTIYQRLKALENGKAPPTIFNTTPEWEGLGTKTSTI